MRPAKTRVSAPRRRDRPRAARAPRRGGRVYDGALPFAATDINLGAIPDTRMALMLNIASPAAAYRWWRLPAKGVGLACMEFIVGSVIEAHPVALVRFYQLEDRDARRRIEALTRGYADKRSTSRTRWRAAWPASPRPSTRTRSSSA